jgi:uncharacterized membrane protein
MLKQFDEVFPGCAERIVSMAEKQSEHRRTLESTVIESNCRSQEHGQTWAGVLMGIALIGGFVLVAIGKPAEGVTAIISAVVGVGGPFLYSKWQQSKERAEKERAFAEIAPRSLGRPAP